MFIFFNYRTYNYTIFFYMRNNFSKNLYIRKTVYDPRSSKFKQPPHWEKRTKSIVYISPRERERRQLSWISINTTTKKNSFNRKWVIFLVIFSPDLPAICWSILRVSTTSRRSLTSSIRIFREGDVFFFFLSPNMFHLISLSYI